MSPTTVINFAEWIRSPDWPGSGKFVDQTPVVLVRMADKNGGGAATVEQRWE